MKTRTIIFIISFFTLAISTFAKSYKVSDLEQPRKYNASNFVSNPDGILSSTTVAEINSLAADIKRRTNSEIAVAVINDYDGGDIDSYATELFNTWGIGEKDVNNGVLLLVARDAREYSILTGRNIGAVLPDVTTARIARDKLIPNFKEGDYDAGVLGAVQSIHQVLTNPEAAAELKENSHRMKQRDDLSWTGLILFYIGLCLLLTAVLAIVAVAKVKTTSNIERHLRYVRLFPFQRILYGLSYVGLGLPLLVYLPYKKIMHNLRDGEHLCPNCNARMHKLDEIHDNERLTPAQDAEERYNSVDYDVWECPDCGEEDIYAFENQDSDLIRCSSCHARTARYLRDRVLKIPTHTSEGLAVKEYTCLNCGNRTQKPYKLPRQNNGGGAAAASIPFILGSMGRGGGGGGFGGGSFGGGITGGGGTSGRW